MHQLSCGAVRVKVNGKHKITVDSTCRVAQGVVSWLAANEDFFIFFLSIFEDCFGFKGYKD